MLGAGTYGSDINIDESITLRGAGKTNKDVILTGVVNVTADNVTLDNIWFQQTYQSQYDDCRLKTTGKNLTVTNSIIQRMTGTAKAYGDIISYNAAEGTLKLVNTELIAPVSGDANAIAAACPSVIGVGAWNQTGTEAWNLVMEGCTVRTNGFAIFDRWNNATYTNTTFAGLEEVEGLPEDVTVLTCYMALNSTHVDNVSFEGCTFKNMRSWGMLVAGDTLSVVGSTFEGTNQSRAISVGGGYGTIGTCTIADNVFDLAGSGYGVKFQGSVTEDSVITIADNVFMNSNNEEDGYAVSNVDADGNKAPVEIKANGSSFINSSVYYVGAVNLEDSETPVADKVVLLQGNGEYYMSTLAEALALARDGDTIRLLADVSETVAVNKNITIEKNGYNLDTSKVTGAENYYLSETEEAYVFTYHHVTKVEAKAPTCTEKGNIAYWYCDDCGKYFKDAGLTEETTLADTVLEMVSHTYKDGTCSVCGAKDPGYKPADSNESGKTDVPKTGDTVQIQLYVYAAFISAIVLVAAISLKKSRVK